MFRILGRFTVTHPWKICAAWLIAGLILTRLAPNWETRAQDDDIHFLPAGVGRDLIRASSDSLDGTTLATVALVIVVLLLVYRAPLLALVPLATIAISVWVALQLLALLTLIPGVYLVNVSKVFAIVILY